ncbi:MAG: hypothetical protein KJP08_10680 [Gammaproteobacteria bacterium]|nr:hypothetical protein [Gammaproteobacteria bacterium]NNF48637.1 hypothetical protein [Woeseiaceae bacterium]MBT8095266.1 hypothetical protein [Gammaproteobacteria bacterium]MBT8105079.1 hypothetical protein [Gammaproteobacteria bacterium]NNK25093.1 hypothetical protein [Woeseiaceae bacterium]
MTLKHWITLFFLCAMLGCAAAPEGDDEGNRRADDCIHEPSIRGYKVLDEKNLIIEAGAGRAYHVVLSRRAFGLRTTWQIAFDAPTSRVCERFGSVVFRGDMGTESIRIDSIRLLTAEEEEDLLITFGKKEPEIEITPEPREVEGADVEELDPDASE